jgi:GAF domain
MPPESDDLFDEELAGWFALHGGAWSGTGSELLTAVRTRVDVGNDLWPQSPRALYAHIESHRQILRSLGVDVWLQPGYPRIISLRSCQDEKPARKPPSGSSGINRPSDPAMNLLPLADDQKTSASDSGQVSPAPNETFSRDIPTAKSDSERFVNGKYADGENFERHVFENVAEALFAIAEMGSQIKEQRLDLKSAIGLVVGRTQEITRCSGVAIGLRQHDSVVYPARAGVATTLAGLHFQAHLFQSCLTGEGLQLRYAQKDPLVGPTCRREGIRSLIVVPICHDREVAGAMELLFKEMRFFSNEDVMTLELIADVVGERLAGVAQIEPKQPGAEGAPALPRIAESTEPEGDKAALGEPRPSFSQYANSDTALGASASLELSTVGTTSTLAVAPVPRWFALKRAWTKCKGTWSSLL